MKKEYLEVTPKNLSEVCKNLIRDKGLFLISEPGHQSFPKK